MYGSNIYVYMIYIYIYMYIRSFVSKDMQEAMEKELAEGIDRIN